MNVGVHEISVAIISRIIEKCKTNLDNQEFRIEKAIPAGDLLNSKEIDSINNTGLTLNSYLNVIDSDSNVDNNDGHGDNDIINEHILPDKTNNDSDITIDTSHGVDNHNHGFDRDYDNDTSKDDDHYNFDDDKGGNDDCDVVIDGNDDNYDTDVEAGVIGASDLTHNSYLDVTTDHARAVEVLTNHNDGHSDNNIINEDILPNEINNDNDITIDTSHGVDNHNHGFDRDYDNDAGKDDNHYNFDNTKGSNDDCDVAIDVNDDNYDTDVQVGDISSSDSTHNSNLDVIANHARASEVLTNTVIEDIVPAVDTDVLANGDYDNDSSKDDDHYNFDNDKGGNDDCDVIIDGNDDNYDTDVQVGVIGASDSTDGNDMVIPINNNDHITDNVGVNSINSAEY